MTGSMPNLWTNEIALTRGSAIPCRRAARRCRLYAKRPAIVLIACSASARFGIVLSSP